MRCPASLADEPPTLAEINQIAIFLGALHLNLAVRLYRRPRRKAQDRTAVDVLDSFVF